jgi:endonuclease YncB( thermonuclease family)
MTSICNCIRNLFKNREKRFVLTTREIEDNDNHYTLDTLKKLNIDLSYLQNVDYKNTKLFIPPVTYGKVIKVYDGDTITIACKLPLNESPIYRFNVRLKGIDSPEIKGKSHVEKMLALKSRDGLANLIMNKIVILKNVSIEKYGRILADIYCDDTYINEWMIQNKYAVVYDGGTKNRPSEWSD